MLAFIYGMAVAHRGTTQTVYALFRIIHKFALCTLRFGIVTPNAGERASLKEDCCPYSRAVPCAKPLYIQNIRFHINKRFG